MKPVPVEAEAFQNYGGWVLDTQFMDVMGSPFLLAHGLGQPVEDATTTVTIETAGSHRAWVRTRDWVAPWGVEDAPGRFELLINGRPVGGPYGTEGADWHWQDGGMVDLPAGEITLALHDLTGFEGRCDAVLLAPETGFRPPNEPQALRIFRDSFRADRGETREVGPYDLVVTGAGIAGCCAALAAARSGLKVALIHDRPVIGGNNSSEVRVWLGGATCEEPYPRIGAIVDELEPARRAHNGAANVAELYEDERRGDLIAETDGLDLLLDSRVTAVAGRDGQIKAVIAQHTRTGERLRVEGRLFVDCTGHGTVGTLAGAEYEITEKGHMGRSNLWHAVETEGTAPFPRCPWAYDLSEKPFPGRQSDAVRGRNGLDALGVWYWESGFDRDPIAEGEIIRDNNFRAMYGAWDALKNVDGLYPKHRLGWAAYISGPRESRRLLGDLVLTQDDVMGGRTFADGCVVTGWKIDLHLPHPDYVAGFEADPFISKAEFTAFPEPFHVPYRCLYSHNVENLFMAGRDVSVTHEALGTVRVMRTCGLMGEVVGLAAALCVDEDTTPRGVYQDHLEGFKKVLKAGVPG